jgi:hypothetical protein
MEIGRNLTFEMAFVNPPSPPFFKGGNGGISAEALLKKEI